MSQLTALPGDCRVAFAAACASRLMPIYQQFSQEHGRGEPKALENALEFVWAHLAGLAGRSSNVSSHVEKCMNLIPDEDENWTPLYAYAEDAASAVTYALRTLESGDAQSAGWAARRVYEALDHFVINSKGIDSNEPGGEQRVLADPLIQREFTRQQRDLNELSAVDSNGDFLVAIASLRSRASTEDAFSPIC